MEAEVERMIKNCIKKRVPNYKHEELKEGDPVIVRLEEGKEWKGPYDVIKSGSTKVQVDVDGTTKDIGRMRVKKWNDWDEMLEEEQTKIGTKSILSKNATETKRMTRSSNKKGVTFDETLFIETPGTSDIDFDNLRKQEQSIMLANLQGNLSMIQEEEEDEFLSSVFLMNIQDDPNDLDIKIAKGEEFDKLEDLKVFGDKVNEIDILQASIEQIDPNLNIRGLSIEKAREALADVLVVELSKKEWDTPECKIAIQKEIDNMKNYGVFGERIKGKLGLEIVGTRLILTKGQKQDGQKTKIKARMVAQGFKESQKSQSDSPTAHRESMRLFLAVCAMLGFVNLSSMDITGAYLQSEDLQRSIYVRLPKEFEPDESYVYKLKKPLYGLSDAGRQFWLKVSKMFKENGYESVIGDECLYRKVDKEGNLIGLVIIHVDDFVYNGTAEFVKQIEDLVHKELTVSKVEKNELRFCGVDYKQTKDGVLASMEDYCESIQEYPAKLLNKEKKTKELDNEQKS